MGASALRLRARRDAEGFRQADEGERAQGEEGEAQVTIQGQREGEEAQEDGRGWAPALRCKGADGCERLVVDIELACETGGEGRLPSGGRVRRGVCGVRPCAPVKG